MTDFRAVKIYEVKGKENNRHPILPRPWEYLEENDSTLEESRTRAEMFFRIASPQTAYPSSNNEIKTLNELEANRLIAELVAMLYELDEEGAEQLVANLLASL